ncbi:septum formation inhibitor Maf [Oerskovia turbata]|uniref:Nucleoside triphosphate pyrophosphatase n=1 Tax=Oerskovia turbata TaxID=1713 RepID=A0A4Q1L432_9CELL|nr:nucleoside triphosphate pyrophosphatase [Oerskovia turbata]RXR26266.1 septum formation inhibitor Maf [Oerskovia turbata]RXR36768.1 septum formation inhibitor Maf [Oerskovia turbata]TGJ97456.1 septum formation inhibitor Maf [Actinotalea fermentans ATCC 43279 = JCM 9966 = DSM 3133]
MTAATSVPDVRLLLASQSPARLATLRSAGVTPEVRVSGLDEDAVLEAAAARFGTLDPADAVLVLAQAKAEEVAQVLTREARERDDVSDAVGPDQVAPVVVGCDSMLELAGSVHGKPRDAAEATERWRAMRGRTGVLHTGHWIVDLRDPQDGGSGATLGATSSTTVHFADVSDAEIAAYVATGEPLAVAGAFTVDGLGGAFVESIEGDHHGVVGISLPLVRELLGEIGVTWTDLWS